MQATQPNSGTAKATTCANPKRYQPPKPDIMGMVRVPIEELTGRALDWAVAHANGWQMLFITYTCSGLRFSTPLPEWAQDLHLDYGGYWLDHEAEELLDAYWPAMTGGEPFEDPYAPSSKWAHAGELIERYKVEVLHMVEGEWGALDWFGEGEGEGAADKPKAAICRARVNRVLGKMISVPAVLLQEVQS